MQTTIYARSQLINQEVRLFNLENQTNIPWTQDQQRIADDFANRLRQQLYGGVQDWVGVVKTEDLGIHTFINSQNSQTPTAPLIGPDN